MSKEPLLEVTYTLTFEDLLHGTYVYAARRRRNVTLDMMGGIVLILVGLDNAYNAALRSGGDETAVAPIMAYLFIVWIGGQMAWRNSPINIRRQIRARLAQASTLTAAHTLTLTHDYFCHIADYGSLHRRWQAVDEVFADSKYLFITVGATAFIIARRNFPTAADAEQFLSLANTYWQTAKQRPLQDEGVWPPAPRTL